jgi:hypothetical protein
MAGDRLAHSGSINMCIPIPESAHSALRFTANWRRVDGKADYV